MIKNIKISVVLIILMLAVVLSISVLSNRTNAEGTYLGGVDLGISNIKECTNTYQLAWWIANNVDAYMNTSNEDIFYNINNGKGKLSVNNEPDATSGGKVDIWYYTCACINHTQQDFSGDGNAWLTAGNIVYLETPGKITAYKKETDGTMKGPVTVDLSDFDTAREIYRQINGSTATFTETEHQEMKKNLSMFIYATVHYTEGGYIGNRTDKPAWLKSGFSSAEAIAKYYLWNKDVQKYIAATGLLYSEFVTGNAEIKVDEEAPKTHSKYQAAVNTLLEQTPILEKAVTTDTPTVEYKNNKAYIGPFKVNYAGGTPSIQIEGTEVNWVTKNSDDGSYNAEQESSKYVSGQEFYAVLDEDSAKALTSFNVELKISYSKYTSKLSFFRNISGDNQTLMYHAGQESTSSSEISWTVEQQLGRQITLQKQDINGNALNIAGIKFEIFDGDTQIATLETDNFGTTNKIFVEDNKEYMIIEKANSAYGYKNAKIASAYIKSGSGEVNLSADGKVTFSITTDSIIAIKNKPELGDITIHKVGENNEDLEGVEFVIWQSDGWLKLNEEVLIKTSNEGIDITQYAVTKVKKVTDATTFKTNSTGKILLKNLEIYSGKSTKYSYWICETSNNNYGYQGMIMTEENVSATGGTILTVDSDNRYVEFEINDNIEITIQNPKQLANIIIHKVGQNNENLEGVEFALWQLDGWLKLNEELLIETSDEGIDITQYTVTKVTKVADATKLKTNSSGKIIVKNLEVYANKSIKNSYCIKEISNSNYGYNLMVVNEENVLLEGGTLQEISSASKWVQFSIDDDTENVEVTIENPKQLGNIELIKVGRDNKPLENVTFKIKRTTGGYIKLVDKDGNKVGTVTGSAIINEKNIADSSTYHVEYVANKNNATIFKTNSDGKIAIENLESEYDYTAYEINNSNYGYGSSVNSSLTANLVDLQIDDTTTITVQNTQDLGNISLTKYNDSNEETVLTNVEFVIQLGPMMKGGYGYIQLVDSNEKIVQEVNGTVTINKDNIATADGKEYKVKYVVTDKTYSELTDAQKRGVTVFKTGDAGTLTVENLEVYDMDSQNKFTYKITEINNPNYGYIVDSTQIENVILETNNTTKLELGNKLALGNIQLTKHESSPTNDKSILIPNVEFAIEVSPSTEKTYSYMALYNSNSEVVPKVKGRAVINAENIASVNGTEYALGYYYTDKPYTELSETEKANITIFITGDDGKLNIENLEVYQQSSSNKYEYKLIEMNNPNYGYVVDSNGLVNATLEENKTTKVELGNKLVYTKVSGYVWIENLSEGKVNEYDCLYTTESTDVKLTNLYETNENGELIWNEDATVPVKIQLRTKDGTLLKEKPDQFDENGKYTFTDVEIENLANYEVVFEYDGFYYTTTLQKLNEDHGSKVQENTTKRTDLNNKFASVQAEGIVSKDGDINKVEYIKDGNISTVSDLELETNISANTNEAYLSAEFRALNRTTSNLVNEVENVNMGIILREQPHVSINSDIYSVLLNFADYNYNYKYNGRQNYYENKDDNEIGVRFEEKFAPTRYTRAVFASDIQAVQSQNKEMKVSITYKIQVANQSVTLSVLPKQIINYFDSRYTIKAVGLELDETTHIAKNQLEYTTPEIVGYQPAYKATVIDFNQLIASGNENVVDLYITFEMSTGTDEGKGAIFGLLNEESTYHNASEILSYSSYYGNETSIYITDKTIAGEVYAGIDKMSQPGNMKLELVEHPTIEGTDILNTEEYEDDTTSAPSLVLQVQESRIISGKIWEDADQDINDNEKIGNGILDSGEKPIAGVKVELYEVDENGNPAEVVAKYSNGEQIATMTAEDGSYKFGKYSVNEDGTIGEFYGVLPGKYVIIYTYNNQSYIVDSSGNTYLNVNDYKSTIIKENEIIDKAIKKQDITYNGVTYPSDRWYVIAEENRYSDAIDNIELRKTLDENTVKNSTYADTELETYVMEAYTPVMDIGIEFTKEDLGNATFDSSGNGTFERIIELPNIDFGIIERPDTNVIIEKQVTSMEITANNGANIIPKGDPSDINSTMQYVKKLDGQVSAEVESSLLQSAVLKLEYTVKVENNSQEDYLEDEYYIYGTNGVTPRNVRVEKVVDYLDNTMTPDFEQSEEGTWIETTADKLFTEEYISRDVRDELNTGKYHIFYTTTFNEVEQGEEKSVKFRATKTLSVSDSTVETNRVEIIELSGGRTIKTSIPGNYIPSGSPTGDFDTEQDTSVVKVVITPATGTTVNYILYIIAIIATFTILLSGIVIIKKKVIK